LSTADAVSGGGFAFYGEIDFPLAITCLFVRQVRRGFVAYSCTPRWAYYDIATGQRQFRAPQMVYALGVRLTGPQARRLGRGQGPVQVQLPELLQIVLLHDAAKAAIECAIENDVRRRDGETLRANGLPPPWPDNWL
jgi:hypothetical protein